MNDEAALRDKLRKIEALFSGAGTAGEKAAAGAAAERIRARLRQEEKREKPVEIALQPARSVVAADVHRAVPAVWPAAVSLSAHAPAERHGAGAARRFLNTVLWPEFQEINAALGRVSGPGDRQGDPRSCLQGHRRRRRGGGA